MGLIIPSDNFILTFSAAPEKKRFDGHKSDPTWSPFFENIRYLRNCMKAIIKAQEDNTKYLLCSLNKRLYFFFLLRFRSQFVDTVPFKSSHT